MAAKRVIRIKLNSDQSPLPPALPVAKKSQADLDLEAIKAKAQLDARKKGTSVATELALLVEHYLNQGR